MVNAAPGQTSTRETAGATMVGKTIAGRYRIEAVVDEGGEAVLYQARHEALGKKVALKVLRASPPSTGAAERFLARAKLAASLSGPHVNRISDFGQSAEGSYVVMDWVDGESVSAWMTQTDSLPLEDALDAAEQVARALAAAHARGVVHGGVDARRLLRVRQGEATLIKVLGFGEQADAQGEGARTDLRALGALLLELTSRARFDGVATFAVRRQREPELDAAVGQSVRKLPAALQAIVVKALALEAAKAYRGVEDLSGDLERFRAGEIPDALLEMIASGSWALIPEEKSAAAVAVRAAAARRQAPAPPPAAPRTKPSAPLLALFVRHRHSALIAALVVAGLVTGWIVSGFWMAPEELAASGGTTGVVPSDVH
jgi:eukaryotic-like serine/threonine-protein kinase